MKMEVVLRGYQIRKFENKASEFNIKIILPNLENYFRSCRTITTCLLKKLTKAAECRTKLHTYAALKGYPPSHNLPGR